MRFLDRRAHLSPAIGAALTLLVLCSLLAGGLIALGPEARRLLDTVPTAAKKLDRELRRIARDKDSAVSKMKEAAAELERAAAAATQSTGKPKPAPEAAAPRADRLFVVGTTTVLLAAANAIVVIALVYFLLVAGDTFKRKLVRISGETLSEKKITVEILDAIDSQIQRYLVTHVATSVLLGVLSWGVFALIGLDNAVFWAVAAALLHLVPYIGSALTMILTGLVAYLQFDGLQLVATVIGSQVVIAYLVGMVLMPWMAEKMIRINAVTIFISLLFWGWLWGMWGLLLSVPIMVTIKAICERIDGLRPIAELLGYEPPRARPVERGAAAEA